MSDWTREHVHNWFKNNQHGDEWDPERWMTTKQIGEYWRVPYSQKFGWGRGFEPLYKTLVSMRKTGDIIAHKKNSNRNWIEAKWRPLTPTETEEKKRWVSAHKKISEVKNLLHRHGIESVEKTTRRKYTTFSPLPGIWIHGIQEIEDLLYLLKKL